MYCTAFSNHRRALFQCILNTTVDTFTLNQQTLALVYMVHSINFTAVSDHLRALLQWILNMSVVTYTLKMTNQSIGLFVTERVCCYIYT